MSFGAARTVEELDGEAEDGLLAGVDIGGTKTHVVVCDRSYRRLGVSSAPTPAAAGGEAMVDVAAELIERLLAGQVRTLASIGVGAAGVVDSDAGMVRVASDSFSGWAGYPVVDDLRSRFMVPTVIDNDVNAFLRGEIAAGAVAGERDALAIMLGTGVGGALWIDGRLFLGVHGAAGEIGHIPGFGDALCTCGGHGHLETRAAGPSIAARYGRRTGRRLSTVEVAMAARSGDVDAQGVFADAGRAVGRAIVMTAGLVDVTTVVVGGGVSRAWDLVEPAIRSGIAEDPPVGGRPITLHRTALGDDAVALGAASLARYAPAGLRAR